MMDIAAKCIAQRWQAKRPDRAGVMKVIALPLLAAKAAGWPHLT